MTFIKRAGFIVVVLAAMALIMGPFGDRLDRRVVVILVLLGVAGTAFIIEISRWFSTSCDAKHPSIPEGARPADGLVDVFEMRGVEGEVLPIRPELRKFVALSGQFQVVSKAVGTGETNRPLLGRVALISVFVGRDKVAWSDPEIATGHEAIERAGIWIEREAMRLGAPVNLSLSDVYFQVDDDEQDLVELAFQSEGDDVGPMEANSLTKAVIMASRLASKLGFSDVEDWMRRIDQRIEADARIWFFHVRRAGRSMAITADDTGIPGVALALCYAREASFPEPLTGRPRIDPATVAHEFLHLFGASDKYNIPLRSFPDGSVTSRDIMRLNHDSLAKLRIDSMTAFEVGWTMEVGRRKPTKMPGDGWVKSPSSGN